MHIFDALHLDEFAKLRERTEIAFSRAVIKGKDSYEPLFVTDKMKMFLDQDHYFKYFDRLMQQPNAISGDFTPSYSAVPTEAFKTIRANFAEMGINLRVVFLMREPVSRAESVLKMRLRRDGKLADISIEDTMQEVRSYVGSRHDQLRASYRTTVENLRSAFDKEQIYLGYYETMFQQDERTRLANFLGISAATLDPQVKVNKVANKFHYPASFLSEMKDQYAETYAYMSAQDGFPKDPWTAALDKITA